MIKHIVIWKFKNKQEREKNIFEFKKKLESMDGRVDVIKQIEVGINVNKKSPTAYDILLYTEFDSLDDLGAYQKDEYHEEIKDYISRLDVESCVVDYEA